MKFSVVIPTLNEQKYIGIILKGLKEQTFKDFEVIIVDGNSIDKTLQVIDESKGNLNLRVVTPNHRGISFQRNYGASLAKNENLIFFDADTFVEKDFIQKLAKYLQENAVDTLTAWNIPISDRKIDHAVAYLFNHLFMEGVKNFKPAAIGTFIFFKKKVFEAVKGFDETIVISEDTDIVERAAHMGFKYALLHDPVVYFSTRRADKEGRLKFLSNTFKIATHYYLKGPIKDTKKVKYEFGNHV